MTVKLCRYWTLAHICLLILLHIEKTTGVNSTLPIIYKGSCPPRCYCQIIRRNSNYLSFDASDSLKKDPILKTLCSNKQLTVFPVDISYETNILFVDHNQLTRLNRSMFYGIDQLMHLSFAHNHISSIANDTFYDLPLLETLDLNHNYLTHLPEGVLCPWLPTSAYHTSFHKSPECTEVLSALTKLALRMQYNRWHCNCKMQKFLESFSCAYDHICVTFVKNREGKIGYCASPVSMKNVPLGSLSSEESASKKVNACAYRKTHIDIPLLVTLLTWIGAVLGYVIYFIAWNNKDVANHRTYLSKLNSRSPYQSYRGSARSVLDTPKSRSRASTMASHSVLDTTAPKPLRTHGGSTKEVGSPSMSKPRAPARQRARSASPRTNRMAFKSTISPLIEEAPGVSEESPCVFELSSEEAKNESLHCSSV